MIPIICVVGARPNFMKIAPILRALSAYPDHFKPILVHTGQHYDHKMSDVFFSDLDMPRPDEFLGVGSGSHATQTAKILVAFEEVLLRVKPGLVLTVGDVNSTLACSIAAKKLHIKIAHVEAGLRSNDRAMPEEINRIVTDSISDYFYTTEPSGDQNLIAEGQPADNIVRVGNCMIDTLFHLLPKAEKPEGLIAEPGKFGLVTLHRPSNVDNEAVLRGLIETLSDISKTLPLVWSIHPGTEKRLEEFGMKEAVEYNEAIQLLPPLGYLQFLWLTKHTAIAFTDSGGLQEETTALGIPCLTIRQNTERPVTITEGSNRLIGNAPDKLLEAFQDFLNSETTSSAKTKQVPELWDGRAAERIAADLMKRFFPDEA